MKTQFTPQGIMPSGHTPGPWVSYPSPKGHAINIHDGRDDTPFELIAHVPLTEKTESGIRFTDERLANARLIAAAPDMLQLISDVGRWLEIGLQKGQINRGTANRDGDLVSQIRAVITKATSQP